MGSLVNLITPYHERTKRGDYLGRMKDQKVSCMEKAREYGRDYWDGDRRFGYGGYHYDGRWKPLAETMITRYRLTNQSRILDVGCGKAFLATEIKKLLPKADVRGFDVSQYGINDCEPEMHGSLSIGRAEDERCYQYPDKSFDLVLANGSLHNLKNWERDVAFQQIERVGKQKYFWVESYRNAQEQFNLQCWALTCWAFQTPEEWVYEFTRNGYTGDYEFIYFE